MDTQMEFPESFEAFAEACGFKDSEEMYTNGADLIPVFRVKQWIEHDNRLRAIKQERAFSSGYRKGQEALIKKVRLALRTDLSWELIDKDGNKTGLHELLMEILDSIGKE